MCRFSNVPIDGSLTNRLSKRTKTDLAPEGLVDTYLGDTPFHSLFLTAVPLQLPAEQRFSGHWIIASPGRGKTTLLHSMFLDDLKRDASIIVMNSKGDLINPIKELQAVKDRLILIDLILIIHSPSIRSTFRKQISPTPSRFSNIFSARFSKRR